MQAPAVVKKVQITKNHKEQFYLEEAKLRKANAQKTVDRLPLPAEEFKVNIMKSWSRNQRRFYLKQVKLDYPVEEAFELTMNKFKRK